MIALLDSDRIRRAFSIFLETHHSISRKCQGVEYINVDFPVDYHIFERPIGANLDFGSGTNIATVSHH